jgi:hypothetical protein
MTIAYARAEQLRCAAQYADPGARLGMHDWFAEEFLMEQYPLWLERNMREILADPATRADILDLLTREVAEWAWPPAYLRVATPEQWAEGVANG